MKISKYIYVGLMGVLLLISAIVTGCSDDTKIPSQFLPDQYLRIVSDREMNISTVDTFEVEVDGSSSWRISSNSTWCHFSQEYYGGRQVVKIKADANRTEAERSCYVKVNAFFKDNDVADSVLVVQPVNKLPALEVTPQTERDVFYKGTTFTLDLVYNYGLDFLVNYIEGGDGWVNVQHEPFVESEKIQYTSMEVTIDPNYNNYDRKAELVFTNIESNKSISILVTQGHTEPAITYFADDFETSTTTGKAYEKEGWTFQSNPEGTLLFKQFFNTRRAMLINGSPTANPKAVGYAVWPVFDVQSMQNKKVSYTWGAGNNKPAEAGDAFELVASLDYEGDAFNCSWTVIQDLTNKAEKPGISLPNTAVEIDLSKTAFANEPRVYLALRYTGGGHAYRFDNLVIGDVEGANEPVDKIGECRSLTYIPFPMLGYQKMTVDEVRAHLNSFRWEGVTDAAIFGGMFYAGKDGTLLTAWNKDEWPEMYEGTDYYGKPIDETPFRNRLASKEIVQTVVDFLKQKDIKVWCSLSSYGWFCGASLTPVVKDEKLTEKFAGELCDFAAEFGCAGIDFDWEFPPTKAEADGYIRLMGLCKARGYQTSVCAILPQTAPNMDWNKIINEKKVDYINVMQYLTYDSSQGKLTTAAKRSSMRAWETQYPKQFTAKRDVQFLCGIGYYSYVMPGCSDKALSFMKLYEKYGDAAYDNAVINGEHAVWTCQDVRTLTRMGYDNGWGGVLTWFLADDFTVSHPDKYSRQYNMSLELNDIWGNK